ncbi:MAG TPA: type II toxin-antitoxin system VapC family toxin [Candidatus Nanoarchaeia archaeon]|nr:type II toxin-antitoxin system VapC family toxin [Candidatus Nanoarchaeia archaeon]
MIVLDTSAVIELIIGSEKGKRISVLLEPEAAAVTAITINEALSCASERQRSIFQLFFKTCHVLPFDEQAAYKSVELEESLYKKGRPLAKPDLFIASICLLHGLPLLTCDSDFTRIDDLEIITP